MHFSKPALSNLGFNGNAIRVFPNPSQGSVVIENAANASVQLFTLSAKSVYAEKLVSNSQRIDLSGLADGYYLMKINTGQSEIVKKIVLLRNR